MSSYVQDELIPIWIFLNYNGFYSLKFPVNPESLKVEIPSDSTTVEVEGLGEVSAQTTPKLAMLSISSFFWFDISKRERVGGNITPPSQYVAWIRKWQKSKQPANLIVTRLNYSMQVTCERFSYDTRAGEERDIYFELDLKEYRPHGARRVGAKVSQSALSQIQQAMEDYMTSPILVEIPLPARRGSRGAKGKIENPFVVTKKNNTLLAITKLVTGGTEDWRALYEENAAVFGDSFEEGDEIAEGTKVSLPHSWVKNPAYNIQSAEG